MTEITPALGLPAYFLGRRIAGQRKRTPVAYLYNGVRLPKLPDFDEPYAVVVDSTIPGKVGYRLIAMGEKPNLTLNEGAYRPRLKCSTVSYHWYFWEGDTKWNAGYFHEYETLDIAIDAVWSNYVMLLDNGTLYLDASDPVPVYE